MSRRSYEHLEWIYASSETKGEQDQRKGITKKEYGSVLVI